MSIKYPLVSVTDTERLDQRLACWLFNSSWEQHFRCKLPTLELGMERHECDLKPWYIQMWEPELHALVSGDSTMTTFQNFPPNFVCFKNIKQLMSMSRLSQLIVLANLAAFAAVDLRFFHLLQIYSKHSITFYPYARWALTTDPRTIYLIRRILLGIKTLPLKVWDEGEQSSWLNQSFAELQVCF